MLITIVPKLEATDRDALEQAILQGPPRTMFREDSSTDQLQWIYDREIWLRLAKCNATGAMLGADASLKLKSLSQQYPEWKLADNEKDEFPFWMGDGEDWRTFLSTPKRSRDLVSWLREHPKKDIWQEDDWRERCKRDYRRAAIALLHLAYRGEWIHERWREALRVWSDEVLVARSWRCVGNVLAIAPDDVTTEIVNALSWWLESIAKTFKGNEAIFLALIHKILALYRNEAIEPDDDRVFKAINHPIGHVTEAALRWWYRQALEDGQGLSDNLKPIFTDLCDTKVASFIYGRLLLATHVITLFRVDMEWSKKYLLPLFNWELSVNEACSAWQGFLASPRLYRPLIEAIKPQFLATAEHYSELVSCLVSCFQ